MCLPQPILTDKHIGKHDELAHDGGDGDLGFFAGRAQPPVEPGQARIEAGCGDGGEVEGGAHMGAPASDPALASGSAAVAGEDRKSTRLNSSHVKISYAVFCLKKKK